MVFYVVFQGSPSLSWSTLGPVDTLNWTLGTSKPLHQFPNEETLIQHERASAHRVTRIPRKPSTSPSLEIFSNLLLPCTHDQNIVHIDHYVYPIATAELLCSCWPCTARIPCQLGYPILSCVNPWRSTSGRKCFYAIGKSDFPSLLQKIRVDDAERFLQSAFSISKSVNYSLNHAGCAPRVVRHDSGHWYTGHPEVCSTSASRSSWARASYSPGNSSAVSW